MIAAGMPEDDLMSAALFECLPDARGYLLGQLGVAFLGVVDVVRQLNIREPW